MWGREEDKSMQTRGDAVRLRRAQCDCLFKLSDAKYHRNSARLPIRSGNFNVSPAYLPS